MLSGVWPGQVVWKSLWGNSHHERDGKNPLLLISRGLMPRLHFALSSKIPPKPRCGGRRERVRFRQHLPRLRRSPSTSNLPHRLYGRMLRLGAGGAEADAVINAPCGRLRSFAAATEGRAELTTDFLEISPWPTASRRLYEEFHKQDPRPGLGTTGARGHHPAGWISVVSAVPAARYLVCHHGRLPAPPPTRTATIPSPFLAAGTTTLFDRGPGKLRRRGHVSPD